jgi:5-methylcytosine-specific restriction enzyme A
MALSDLTASAVVKAIEEFDQLGRDSFLKKYGFGRARGYVLQKDGHSYDSKAISKDWNSRTLVRSPRSAEIHLRW